MKDRTHSLHSNSTSTRAVTNSSALIKKNDVDVDAKKKQFLKNKNIQAEAIAAVEAEARLVDSQAHVPDNSN